MDPAEARKKLYHLQSHAHYDDGVAYAHEVLAAAVEQNDRRLEVDATFFLGAFYVENMQYPEAWDTLVKAIAGRSEVYGPNHLLTTQARAWAACTASCQEKVDERRALTKRVMAAIPEECPPEYNVVLSDILDTIAHIENHAAQPAQALEHARRGLQLIESAPDADELELARASLSLGLAEENAGHYERAGELMQRALDIRIRHLGEDNLLVGFCRNHLATLLIAEGDFEAATSHADASIATLEKLLPGSRQAAASLTSRAAIHLMGENNYEKAVATFEKAIRNTERVAGQHSPHLAAELLMLSAVHRHFDKEELAESVLRRALLILTPYHRSQLKMLNDAVHELATVLVLQKKGKELVAIFEPVYDRLKNEPLVDATLLARVVNAIATGYRFSRKPAKAEKLLLRALAILEVQWGPNSVKLRPILHNLSVLMEEMGRRTDASSYRLRMEALLAKAN